MTRKRRVMQDRFDVEIQMPYLEGRLGRQWTIIKDFDDGSEAYQYERAHENESPETPVRVKHRRVPVAE